MIVDTNLKGGEMYVDKTNSAKPLNSGGRVNPGTPGHMRSL